MTRKIVVTQYISVDGVIQDPVGIEGSGLGDWIGPFTRGPEGDQFKVDELMQAESLIFGRTTYDGFAASWPLVKDTTGYAERMNTLPRIVASSALQHPGWGPTTVWNGDLVAAARAYRNEGQGTVLIFGSGSVVHQLAPAGLIDEYRLLVYPTIVGGGRRLYADGVQTRLSLAEYRRFGDGVILLRYCPA